MKASIDELEEALRKYDEALELKQSDRKTSARLVELDKQFRKDFRSNLNDKQAKQTLENLMEWKLARGKFRPALMGYIKSNADANVQKIVEEFSNDSKNGSLKDLIDILTQLKGIGPATASAIMSFAEPERFIFMSDEVLEFGAGLEEKPKYTITEYNWLIEQIKKRLINDRKEYPKANCLLSLENFEMACWSFAIHKRFGKQSSSSNSSKRKSEIQTKQQTKVNKAKKT